MPKYKIYKDNEFFNTIVVDDINSADLSFTYEEVVDEVITPIEEVSINKTIDIPSFLMLFTFAERTSMRALISTDDLIKDFFSIIDDPRTANLDLQSSFVQDVLTHLVSLQILTEDRKTEINN